MWDRTPSVRDSGRRADDDTTRESGSARRADRREIVEEKRERKARMGWTLRGTSRMLEIRKNYFAGGFGHEEMDGQN